MRRLIVVTALLAAVSSASAVGVGISGHYNLGLPMGNFGNAFKFSVVGLNADIEIDFGAPIIPYVGFGYQVFKPDVGTGDLTVIPILFGIEYRQTTPWPVIAYVGGGGSFNLFRTSSTNWNDYGVWIGGEIYYFVTPQLGIGANLTYHAVFTTFPAPYSISNAYWIHPSFGVKYWI